MGRGRCMGAHRGRSIGWWMMRSLVIKEGLEEDLRSAVAVKRLNMHRGRVEEGSQRGNKEGRKRDNVCFSTKPARLLPCSITLHRMLHTLL